MARVALVLAVLLLVAASPAAAAASSVVIGRSSQGRAIKAVRLGNPHAKRTALIVGQIHGDEPGGLAVTRALRGRGGLGDVDLWVIDSANPDGGRAHRRQNARGVDLNRNFPYRWTRTRRGDRYYGGPAPLSEPESRALSAFIQRVRPDVSIWYHQPWGAVLVPCGGKPPLERLYARLAGLPTSCRGDGLRGTAVTWQNARVGGHAFVVELGAAAPSPAVAIRNARAAVRVVATAPVAARPVADADPVTGPNEAAWDELSFAFDT
ncbi:MAG: murein peptide amidase, partial [Thermoleophilaceae bacterium]|nr:murein peptide amidase [Thermoleophilaceae bacterium]